jgi:flagellar biosynthetic protein FliR
VLSTGWLISAFLVASRLGAVIMIMPVVGNQGIPAMVKLLLTLSLTAVIAPVIPATDIPFTVSQLVFMMSGELLMGFLVGGAMRMMFGVLHFAGEAIGMQIGHAAAAMFDPLVLSSAGPLTRMATLLGGGAFLGADLHLHLLHGMAMSFDVVGPGMAVSPLAAAGVWPGVAAMVIKVGAQMAAPIMALVFLVNLFVAMLTRLAPSMNVFFSLGLILTLIAGHLLFYLALPNMLDRALRLMASGLDLLPVMWQAVGG